MLGKPMSQVQELFNWPENARSSNTLSANGIKENLVIFIDSWESEKPNWNLSSLSEPPLPQTPF